MYYTVRLYYSCIALSMQAGFRRRRSLRSLVVAAKLMRFGSGCHWEHSGSSVSAYNNIN